MKYKMNIQILYFRTTWCEICKKITPYYQWLSQYYKDKDLKFYIFTLDNRPELEKTYKLKEYPTFLIFKNKREIYRQEIGNLAHLKIAIDKFI